MSITTRTIAWWHNINGRWLDIPHMLSLDAAMNINPLCDEVYLLSKHNYCKTSNISCTLVDNEIVDHSYVAGASPVGAAPTTSSLSTESID